MRSKLYEAISRLDEIASLEERNQPFPEIPFRQAQTKSNSSLLRLAILLAIMIFMGLLALGITSWWQDWFDLGKESPVQFIVPPELSKNNQREIAPSQEKKSIERGMTPTNFESIPETTYIDGNHTAPEVFSSSEIAEDRQITIQPLVVTNTPNVIVEPLPLLLSEETDTSTFDKIIAETSQLSRWLQQAEQHRLSGDWEGAVVLFAKVWQKSKNPAVANNLAASLIELDRWQEASEILAIALSKSPEDQDLKQNLDLVQRLMH